MNIRPRRNRKSMAIRAMVEETKLGAENLIYPIFLEDGKGIKTEIKSLPNNYRWSLDLLLPEIELNKIWVTQKFLSSINSQEGMEFLIDKLKKFKTNQEFLDSINKKSPSESQ